METKEKRNYKNISIKELNSLYYFFNKRLVFTNEGIQHQLMPSNAKQQLISEKLEVF